LLEAEVVELADRGVSGGPHLAVDRLVVGADALGGLPVRELEHRVAPGPEVAALGAAAQGALEGVAVCVDEARVREPVGRSGEAISLPAQCLSGTGPAGTRRPPPRCDRIEDERTCLSRNASKCGAIDPQRTILDHDVSTRGLRPAGARSQRADDP